MFNNDRLGLTNGIFEKTTNFNFMLLNMAFILPPFSVLIHVKTLSRNNGIYQKAFELERRYTDYSFLMHHGVNTGQ